MSLVSIKANTTKLIRLFAVYRMDAQVSCFEKFIGDGKNKPSNWKRGELLGHGAHAKVYLVTESGSRTGKCAVKQVNVSDDNDTNYLETIQKELKVFLKVQHHRIVDYYDFTITPKFFSLFIGYFEKGSLATYIKEQPDKRLTEQKAAIFTSQILEGLEYLHKERIIHRDIKGSNILMQSESSIKISDFGIAKIVSTLSRNTRHKPGTVNWMAPEMWMDVRHDSKVDIWSLGCTVYQMVTGEMPVKDLSEQQITAKALKNELKVKAPDHSSPVLKEFISLACEKKPTDRPPAYELKQHEFVRDVKASDENIIHRAGAKPHLSSRYAQVGTADSPFKLFKKIHDEGLLQNFEPDALLQASQKGQEKLVIQLLERGDNVDMVNSNGMTSLMLASSFGHEKVLNLLLEAGSKVNLLDNKQHNALMWASMCGNDLIVGMLLEHDADVNQINTDGMDALMLAASNGHNKTVEVLLKKGTDVNRIDKNGSNALIWAASKRNQNAVKLLIEYGSNLNVNQVNKNGWSALMWASIQGQEKSVALLLKNNVDVTHVNSQGWDSLYLAASNGKEKIVELFLKNGSNYGQTNILKFNAEKIVSWVEVMFIAFENGHKKVIETFLEMFTTFKFETTYSSEKKLLLKMCELFLDYQDMNFDKLAIKKDTFKETCHRERRCISTLSCYLDLIIKIRQNNIPTFEELQKSATDVMTEYLKMNDFHSLEFYIYQHMLNKIFCVIECYHTYKSDAFFHSLCGLHYVEETVKHLSELNLIQTTQPEFSLPLARDMLLLFSSGCFWSDEFALCLAECKITKLSAKFLSSHIDIQSYQSFWITKLIVGSLHNIARKKGAKLFFDVDEIKTVLLSFSFQDDVTSFTAKLVLWMIEDNFLEEVTTKDEKTTLIECVKEAVKRPDRHYKGFRLSDFLQGLANISKQKEAWIEIVPLLDTLKNILINNDPEELEHTTECLKEISSSQEASQQILSSDELTDILNMLSDCVHSDIINNVNSIFWRTGRAMGELPLKPDKVLSDDFPKEFTIMTEAIGSGGFGSVHLIKDSTRPDEKIFVAKKLNFSQRFNMSMSICKQEAMILIKTKHRRIVQFHGFLKRADDFFIFLEYLKNGTLSSYIQRRGNLDETLTRHFTIQILDGVNYLHQNKILHRDIKGDNILMEDDMNIKLTDFGLSEIIDGNGVDTEKGTVRYMAPEVIYTEGNKIINFTTRTDIWSVGCTVIEMLTGKPPCPSLTSAQIIFRTALGTMPNYQIPTSSSVYLREFLDKVLHREAKQRPTADWLLKYDPFIVENLH